MFKAVQRVDYTVSADVEAERIRKENNAYAVRYTGSRLFVVFETVNDIYDYICCEERYKKEEARYHAKI